MEYLYRLYNSTHSLILVPPPTVRPAIEDILREGVDFTFQGLGLAACGWWGFTYQELSWPCLLRSYPYRGTSLIRNCLLVGPYSRTMPRALWWSKGGLQFLMSDVPLYEFRHQPNSSIPQGATVGNVLACYATPQ